MLSVDQYVEELRQRLANPAVSDVELRTYIIAALRDVDASNYVDPNAADAQVLDTACQLLYSDGKFPDVGSISQGGVSTSFSGADAEKFKERLTSRRSAAWMQNMYGTGGDAAGSGVPC